MSECQYQHCILDGTNEVEVGAHDVVLKVNVCDTHKKNLEKGYPIALYFHLKPPTGGTVDL